MLRSRARLFTSKMQGWGGQSRGSLHEERPEGEEANVGFGYDLKVVYIPANDMQAYQ